MKTAVVYYSLEGNCALAARILGEIFAFQTGEKADLFEIQTADTKKRRGLRKFLWGGGQVLMGSKPALQPLDFDPAAYGLVVVGTPVWAASPAPPVRAFLEKTPIRGKRIALFICHAGGKGRALEKLEALLPGNECAGGIDLVNPSGNLQGLQAKLEAWVETLRGSAPAPA
ncbi:MAG: flavodoxin [Treponema sp.]|jgi:flavodoxin|nr:flavodoxin [Treponema sp.]